MPEFRIRPVRGGEDIAAVEDLLAPGPVPDGLVLIGRGVNGAPLGCAVIARADARSCALLRLAVAPEGRGLGLGTALLQAAAERAARMGCERLTAGARPGGFCARRGFRPLPGAPGRVALSLSSAPRAS